MKIQLIITSLACASLSSCSTANAFRQADTDQDGSVDFMEFDTYMKQAVFEKIDSNNDGKITLEEWRQFNPGKDDSGFKKTDTNGDGAITRAEADAAFDREGYMKKLFNKIDKDQSGSLNREEVDAFGKAVREYKKSNA